MAHYGARAYSSLLSVSCPRFQTSWYRQVLENQISAQVVILHKFTPTHDAITVKWKPLYYTSVEEGDKLTLRVTEFLCKEPVAYAAVKLTVDLLVEGDVNAGSLRALDLRGYHFHQPEHPVIDLLTPAPMVWGPHEPLQARMETVCRVAQGRKVTFDPAVVQRWGHAGLQVDYLELYLSAEFSPVSYTHLTLPTNREV